MKGLDFIKLMRKVIREEVRQVVREELKAAGPILMENRNKVVAKSQPNTKQPTQAIQHKQPTKPAYSSEIANLKGPIGDILRETAISLRSNNNVETQDWPDMNSGYQSTPSLQHMNPFGQQSLSSILNDDEMDSEPVAMNSIHSNDPTAVFMKDYSSVLKSADKLAGNYREA
jgi:hypothetical protein